MCSLWARRKQNRTEMSKIVHSGQGENRTEQKTESEQFYSFLFSCFLLAQSEQFYSFLFSCFLHAQSEQFYSFLFSSVFSLPRVNNFTLFCSVLFSPCPEWTILLFSVQFCFLLAQQNWTEKSKIVHSGPGENRIEQKRVKLFTLGKEKTEQNRKE
jgi:hypothetical protein